MAFPLLMALGALGKIGGSGAGASLFSKIGMGAGKINPSSFFMGSDDGGSAGPDEGEAKRAAAKAEVLRQAYAAIPAPNMARPEPVIQTPDFLEGGYSPAERPNIMLPEMREDIVRRFLLGR